MSLHRIGRRAIVFSAISLLSTLAPASWVQAQSGPIVMKVGTATINDVQHEWMKRFADFVAKDGEGKIKVEIYPASQLGAIPRMIEGTQFGSIQAFVGPPEFLSGVDSRYEILSSPGLFTNLDHANKTLQDPAFNQAFLNIGKSKGLKGIGLFVNGPSVINTRQKAHKLADLQRLKIRVLASPVQMEQIRKMGATPVPMALSEVLPALQQGTIDGVMSVLPVLAAFRYYDAARYMLETDHSIVSVVSVVNTEWFDKLTPPLQKVVVDAGQRASREVYPWAVDFIVKQRALWTANGGEVARLDPAEQAALLASLAPIGKEVASRKANQKALYDVLVDAAQRSR
ncbi:TRAP transporter substrate-binding protein [Pigmentiphaga litoralis]|uniref:TRAP-type C4-dicarboxylate transport system substrate-binding protein n=1 Tax=Pigmentiphaga litoralis TaxID=516702 RepID=A0A7Y9ITY0_9BURK|nr:TRAP transporter substrate-binding protein [Pigmentiphaga litoralis]NYE23384.1 TRAP-type C4-dicarboxylate transport system substrate-binding protein [Pigmentiphaga litoralis]NYE83002.1 TRAP-type C4-dicarboxylate transport system substrate-binding protein [Pigmentiphaga litoralis]